MFYLNTRVRCVLLTFHTKTSGARSSQRKGGDLPYLSVFLMNSFASHFNRRSTSSKVQRNEGRALLSDDLLAKGFERFRIDFVLRHFGECVEQSKGVAQDDICV